MSRVRVVIADPDERLLSQYRDLLGDDFELFTAQSARECIARLQASVPEVLVLEPRLPDGGAATILRMMHADPLLTNVPVMILTACRDRVLLESVAPYRISDYRVKPLAPAQLATRIRNVLDYRFRRSAAAGDVETERICCARRSVTAIVGI